MVFAFSSDPRLRSRASFTTPWLLLDHHPINHLHPQLAAAPTRSAALVTVTSTCVRGNSLDLGEEGQQVELATSVSTVSRLPTVRDPVVSDQLNHPCAASWVQLLHPPSTTIHPQHTTNHQHPKCLPTGHTPTASPATSRQTAPHTAPSPAGWQSTNSRRTPAPALAPLLSVVLATHGRTRNPPRA